LVSSGGAVFAFSLVDHFDTSRCRDREAFDLRQERAGLIRFSDVAAKRSNAINVEL
jgi:hypothetical protein